LTSALVTSGASTSYTINIGRTAGFTAAVNLSVAGLPSGARATFNPNPALDVSSTLSITTTAETQPGTYTLMITGTSGSLTRNATVTLVVDPPSFDLSVSPSSRTITQGGSTTYTVNIVRAPGFTGVVTLSVSSLPPGAAGTFSPIVGDSSTLTVATSGSTPTGDSQTTIVATSGSVARVATVTLVVSPAGQPDFSLNASPLSQTVTQGASTTYTIDIVWIKKVTAAVVLSVSGLPVNATGTFSPIFEDSSTLTVTTAGTTPTGNFPLTITGTSGSLTRTASVELVINLEDLPARAR
jgi:uncharacterized membrane protein